MNSDKVQQIMRAWRECCSSTIIKLTAVYDNVDDWIDAIDECCATQSAKKQEIIDELTEWAAVHSATYTDFLCKEQDIADIQFSVVFEDYLCQQIVPETTTTTTTTVDPELVEYSVEFENYLCQQLNDPSVTTTAPPVTIDFSAEFTDFLCAMEDNPAITTTTTTSSVTTTTVEPGLIDLTATFTDFLCAMEDNPDITTTTTTTTIDENNVEYTVEFECYLCQMEDITTTTTTSTTAPVTTTTTTVSTDCGTPIAGDMAFPEIHYIDLGSDTGIVTLQIDTLDVPDKFVVEWNGSEVIDTGYRGDAGFQSELYSALAAQGELPELIVGSGTGTFTFNKTTSDPIATVKIYAPIDETEWSFTLSCPGEGPVTTTTTTSTEAVYSGTYTDFLCAMEDNPSITTTSTTTAPVTTTTTTMAIGSVSCGASWNTGGYGYPQVYIVSLGATTGNVKLEFDTNLVPDRFVVEFEGVPVIDTGYRGDSALQTTLDEALAALGESSVAIAGASTGAELFLKTTATTFCVVKVYAPIPETEWSFRILCPPVSTTTTSQLPTTTTTTTATPVTTTTTTNAAPVSTNNGIINPRRTEGESLTLIPSNFTFTDAEGDALEYVRLDSFSLAGAGTLTYNGVAVTPGQIITVVGGASGSFIYALVYTSDAADESAYDDEINFSVKTANNPNFG